MEVQWLIIGINHRAILIEEIDDFVDYASELISVVPEGIGCCCLKVAYHLLLYSFSEHVVRFHHVGEAPVVLDLEVADVLTFFTELGHNLYCALHQIEFIVRFFFVLIVDGGYR